MSSLVRPIMNPGWGKETHTLPTHRDNMTDNYFWVCQSWSRFPLIRNNLPSSLFVVVIPSLVSWQKLLEEEGEVYGCQLFKKGGIAWYFRFTGIQRPQKFLKVSSDNPEILDFLQSGATRNKFVFQHTHSQFCFLRGTAGDFGYSDWGFCRIFLHFHH